MHGEVLHEVDFARHHRRFTGVLGHGRRLGVCSAEGELLWASDGEPDSGTAQAVARLNREGFVWDCNGAGYQHHVIDADNAMHCVPIVAAGRTEGRTEGGTEGGSEGEARPVASGWLVLLGAQSQTGSDAAAAEDRAVAALRELAGAVQDELGLRCELDALARELAERYEELHLVYNIDAHLKNFARGWEAFKGLVELSARHLNADVAALVTTRGEGTVWATNLSKPIFNLDLVLVEMRGDLFRFIQAGREALVLNDANDPRRPYVFTDMPYKVLACPLLEGRNVSAVLVLIRHQDRVNFSASDRKLAQVTANQFSNLLHLSQTMEEVKSFTEQMAAALIEAVEAKDPYTRGHSERVRQISYEIGAVLGLPQAELLSLAQSALLHDVGKIGIPDAVLCKPGALTRDEYTFIKVHPTRGGEILRHIERLGHVLPGVLHHHERMDGGGYPDGLAGKAIPLQGRIIAVADTYDSITSSRAYRPGRSHEQALAEIQRVSGTQLDPDAVGAFLAACAAGPAWIRELGAPRAHQTT